MRPPDLADRMRQQRKDFFPIITESAGNLAFSEGKDPLRFPKDRKKRNEGKRPFPRHFAISRLEKDGEPVTFSANAHEPGPMLLFGVFSMLSPTRRPTRCAQGPAWISPHTAWGGSFCIQPRERKSSFFFPSFRPRMKSGAILPSIVHLSMFDLKMSFS